jgi:hypothetical protein
MSTTAPVSRRTALTGIGAGGLEAAMAASYEADEWSF